MPPTHDDAICLRHREWSETSQTVTLLTRAHGLVHGIAKGSFREKAPFSGGFEHLQLGELGFINKPDRELAVLTDWDLIDPFHALRADYRAATIGMLAAELAASLLAPFDPHPVAFESLATMLARLGHGDPVRALSLFLVELLGDTGHGFEPPKGPIADDAIWAFSPAASEFTPDPERRLPVADPFGPETPRGVWHLRGETLAVLQRLGDPEEPSDELRASFEPTAWTRLARFLTACAVYRSARRPMSFDAFQRVTQSGGASAGSA